jgi:tape measure domain-containing protein
MAIAGTLTYKTELNTQGLTKGLDQVSAKTIAFGNLLADAFKKVGSVIEGSLDGAITRYDTLNNFPKVMKNLGIETSKSQKSIDKMSKELSGLPTTLDQGALAVQRFTSANGDIEKSTDIFLALNNAILAGGASADIQANALEQLSQAYSAGKMEMPEWRALQLAMPAQLKQVAEAMGLTTDELGAMLRQGDNTKETMDEFLDTIIQLNKEGIGELPSISEQARNGIAGIGTSITNAKTQVVKGVTDIIDSLNKLLEDTELESISNIIKILGEDSKKVLDKVAEKLPDLMKLTPTLLGIFGAMKTASPLFSTLSSGSSLLSDEVLKLGDKFGFLDSKMLGVIGKAGGVTTAIFEVFKIATIGGAIIAGLGVLEKNFGKEIDKWIATAEKKAPELVQKFADSVQNNLPTILEAGKKLLEQLLNLINQNAPSIINSIISIITQLITTFFNMLPQIIDTLLTLAESVIESLAQQMPTLIPKLVDSILKIIPMLLEHLPELVSCGVDLLLGLADGILIALPQLISQIPDIIVAIVNALLQPEMLLKLKSVGPHLMFSLARALIENIPNLLLAVPRIIVGLFTSFRDTIKNTNWKSLGKNIIMGILNGFGGIGSAITNAVKSVKNAIVGKFKSIFSIHSPSRLMADEIGKYIPSGVSVGIEANTDSVLDSIDDMYDQIDKAISVENSKLSLNAISGDVYNKAFFTTPVAIDIKADVEMDNERVGRIITPSIAQTFKQGGYDV